MYVTPAFECVNLEAEGTIAESVVNMTTTVITAQQDYQSIGDCNVWQNNADGTQTQKENGNVIWKD